MNFHEQLKKVSTGDDRLIDEHQAIAGLKAIEELHKIKVLPDPHIMCILCTYALTWDLQNDKLIQLFIDWHDNMHWTLASYKNRKRVKSDWKFGDPLPEFIVEAIS